MLIRTYLKLYRCLLCQRHYQGTKRLCHYCYKYLPWLTDNCYRCASPISPYRNYCNACMLELHPIKADHSVFCFHYKNPISYMIKAWKFHGQLKYEIFFANTMVTHLKNKLIYEEYPQAIIAVPISKQRYRERGFNQAAQLSKYIAKQLNLPRLDHHMSCYHQTKHQAELSATQRAQHLQNTFYLTKQLPSLEHIAIIDDVMTTGSTLNAMAMLLKQQGVTKISYWGLARVTKDAFPV